VKPFIRYGSKPKPNGWTAAIEKSASGKGDGNRKRRIGYELDLTKKSNDGFFWTG